MQGFKKVKSKTNKLILTLLISTILLISNKFHFINFESQLIIEITFLLFTLFDNIRLFVLNLFYLISFNYFVYTLFLPISTNYIVIYTFILYLYLRFIKINRIKTFSNRFSFYLLFSYLALVILLNSGSWEIYQNGFRFLTGIFSVLLFYEISRELDIELKHLIQIFLYSSFAGALYIIYLNIVLEISLVERINQVGASITNLEFELPDRNYTSAIFSLAIVLTLVNLKNSTNVIYLLALILFIGVQILLTSRGGIITSSIGIIAYFILSGNGFKEFTRIASVFLILLLFTIFLFDVTPLINRFTESNDDIATANDRTIIWADSYSSYNSQNLFNKIFGNGFGHSISNLSDDSIHNSYLEIMYDFGIVGLVLFCITLFQGVYHGNLSQKVITVCLMLVSVSLSPMSTVYSFFLLGLILYRGGNEFKIRKVNSNMK